MRSGTAIGPGPTAVTRTDGRVADLRKTLESIRTATLQLDTRIEGLATRQTSITARLAAQQALSVALGNTEQIDLAPLEAALASAQSAIQLWLDSAAEFGGCQLAKR